MATRAGRPGCSACTARPSADGFERGRTPNGRGPNHARSGAVEGQTGRKRPEPCTNWPEMARSCTGLSRKSGLYRWHVPCCWYGPCDLLEEVKSRQFVRAIGFARWFDRTVGPARILVQVTHVPRAQRG